ncbi:Protein kinase domain-containing protein [Aphelenchoides bicaudatus]|nr:Protein kinase domain-containing protein [Aphelenchoides bicaudatus]
METNDIVFTSIATLKPCTIAQSKIGYGSCRSADEFEKLKLCGEGSYGVVWKGLEKSTGKEFALKKLRLKPNEDVCISVIREIHALRSLKHENIVRLEDVVVGKMMHKIFLVMEYCEMDLASILNHMQAPFLESQVKCLLLQLFEGLDYLHSRFYVHRDIKLSNLLMKADGILKIGDFGLARLFGQPNMAMTNGVVTLWYRAPELLLGSEFQGTGIDMWSCGCIMAELLLHKPFLAGDTEIDQLHRIIAMFGTPTPKIWPGLNKLSFPKGFLLIEQPFNNLKKHFPTQSNECLDLMYTLFVYDPEKRASASDCFDHPYFDTHPLPCRPDLMPSFHSLMQKQRKLN